MFFFFFNDTATTEIYTLSLHDALPIFVQRDRRAERLRQVHAAARAGPADAARRRPDAARRPVDLRAADPRDRKSTRLNSSHANISYAVFCLKKKKNSIHNTGSFH